MVGKFTSPPVVLVSLFQPDKLSELITRCSRVTMLSVTFRSIFGLGFRLHSRGRHMIRIIIDTVLFSCMGAFITGIVVAAATFIG